MVEIVKPVKYAYRFYRCPFCNYDKIPVKWRFGSPKIKVSDIPWVDVEKCPKCGKDAREISKQLIKLRFFERMAMPEGPEEESKTKYVLPKRQSSEDGWEFIGSNHPTETDRWKCLLCGDAWYSKVPHFPCDGSKVLNK